MWATDITYLKLDVGYVYLVAIMDFYSRKVLSRRVSLSMVPISCIEALKDAMQTYRVPAIFNTDQGSRFTSYGFSKVFKVSSIEISILRKDSLSKWFSSWRQVTSGER